MKTKIISILLLAALTCFGQGDKSPKVDSRGFIGGTFTGNASGLTNILATNYFAVLKITNATAHGTMVAGGTPFRITNWNSSMSFGAGVNPSLGYVTNNVASYWTIDAVLSVGASGLENYNFVVFSNDVAINMPGFASTVPDAGYIQTCPIQTTLWLPANTRISIGVFTDVADQTSQPTLGEFRLRKL